MEPRLEPYSPGDKVLVLTAGKFGERWTGLARLSAAT